jgi:hypothetical protein
VSLAPSDTPATPTDSDLFLSEKVPEGTTGDSSRSAEESPFSPSTPAPENTSRYFIMKSYAKGDLDWSVANKLWATQPHNEKVLNDAFRVRVPFHMIF